MRKIIAPFAVLALAAACQPEPADEPVGIVGEEPAPPAGVAAPAPTPAPAPPGVQRSGGQHPLPVGEYRLAGADGSDINLGHAITVSISEDTIALVSQCVTPRWTYTYADQRLTTRSIPDPICERGRYPAEEAAIAVFGSPETIRRTPENGWYLEGGGHSITLFSQ